jgi:hypothetical protein
MLCRFLMVYQKFLQVLFLKFTHHRYVQLTTGMQSPILGSLAQGFVAEVIGGVEVSSSVLIEHLAQILDWPYGKYK